LNCAKQFKGRRDFILLTAAGINITVFWVVAPCSKLMTLMMESASTSETSVNFYQTTRRNNPEDSYIQINGNLPACFLSNITSLYQLQRLLSVKWYASNRDVFELTITAFA
jgi:hypothetical protein